MVWIDLHCDTLDHLTADSALTLRRNTLSVDVEKLRKGQVLAQFFAMFVDAQAVASPLVHCQTMLACARAQFAANAADLSLVRNSAELAAAQAAGKIAAFLTIEEGGVLEGKLEHLYYFFEQGVRLITLTWNYPNEIGFPNARPEYRQQGLTAFGQEVVREMNRLGMLVDVSHLSDQGFWDVASASRKPFIASHSNARAVTPHPRNLTDEMLRALGEAGGVAGINFKGDFLCPVNESRVADMVRHICHIRNVAGSEAVALGSDFDGIDSKLEIADSSQLSRLQQALAQQGLHDGEIEKICYQNAWRVIQECLG